MDDAVPPSPDAEATTRLETAPRTDERPTGRLDADGPASVNPMRIALDGTAVAAVAFLSLVALGAFLLAAVKLRFPELGRGADPVSVLTTTVLLGLAVLRVPIEAGGLQLYALPLGAFGVAAATLVWAGRALATRAPALRAWAVGAVLGGAFGLLCLVAALLFRFPDRQAAVAADALGALALGFVWAALFGAVGAGLGKRRIVAVMRDLATRPLRRFALLRAALRGTLTMLGVAAAAAVVALGVWLAAGIEGRPASGLGLAGLVAVVLLVLAFAPNLVVLLVALGTGASIQVGAKTSLGGALGGPERTFSLFDWPGRAGTPGYAYLLVLIPIAAGVMGGRAIVKKSGASNLIAVVACSVLLFAGALTLLAWLGEARVAVAPGRPRGFGRLGADLGILFIAACGWAGLGAGAAAWWSGRRERRGEAA